MREHEHSVSQEHIPERFRLTGGLIGGLLLNLGSLIEKLNRIEKTVKKTIFP